VLYHPYVNSMDRRQLIALPFINETRDGLWTEAAMATYPSEHKMYCLVLIGIIVTQHRRLVAPSFGEDGLVVITGAESVEMVSNTWFPWFPGLGCHSIRFIPAHIIAVSPQQSLCN
jgi:hypothetical protein